MEKRREHRVHKFLQVQMHQQNSPISGSSVDVSPYGMRVRLHLRKILAPAQKVELKVVSHGHPYAMNGVVRWYKRDVVDNTRYVGLAFTSLNPQFCEDILKKTVGSKDLPFRCYYASQEAFFKEYLENIVYGGLFMKTETPQPPLYSQVNVELVVPEKERPFQVEGEVVAHVPGGFGLKLLEMSHCRQKLNAWMNTA